jgi:hypothetical protein
MNDGTKVPSETGDADEFLAKAYSFPHPRALSYECEGKGVRGESGCKYMKTKVVISADLRRKFRLELAPQHDPERKRRAFEGYPLRVLRESAQAIDFA